nr:hypothetical protein [Desulfobulbaceae bacterium]
IKQGLVINRGRFNTRNNAVLLDNDNINNQLSGFYDLQLFAPGPFTLALERENSINTSAVQGYKRVSVTVNGDPRALGTPEFNDPLNKSETAFNKADMENSNRTNSFVPLIVLEGYSVDPVQYNENSLKEDEDEEIEDEEELELLTSMQIVQ